MAIERTEKRGRTDKGQSDQWFLMSRHTAQDTALSWDARGVLGYLLSKPDGWEWRERDLIANGPAGKHVIRRILRELRDAGYLVATREHNAETGEFSWTKTIYERPVTIDRLSGNGPSPDYPTMDEPSPDYPTMVNRSIYKEERVQNTELENTEAKKCERSAAAPPPTPAAAPAIELLQQTYPKLKPSQEQLAAIAATITDLERWRYVLRLWKENEWRPVVGNLLDRYRKECANEQGSSATPHRGGRLPGNVSPTSERAGNPAIGVPPPPGSPPVLKPWEIKERRAARLREHREQLEAERAAARPQVA